MDDEVLVNCATNYKLWIINENDDNHDCPDDHITRQDYGFYIMTVRKVLDYLCANNAANAKGKHLEISSTQVSRLTLGCSSKLINKEGITDE